MNDIVVLDLINFLLLYLHNLSDHLLYLLSLLTFFYLIFQIYFSLLLNLLYLLILIFWYHLSIFQIATLRYTISYLDFCQINPCFILLSILTYFISFLFLLAINHYSAHFLLIIVSISSINRSYLSLSYIPKLNSLYYSIILIILFSIFRLNLFLI